MTCIAAAVDPDGTIWMGADSVGLQGDCVRIDRRSKVFRVGAFLIGSAGSQRVGQILEYTFDPPAIASDLTAYMVREFVPALRAHMDTEGAEIKQDSQRARYDGHCVIGIDGQLFEIDTGYAVVNPRAPFYAIGCASQEAMAAMFTARSLVEGIPAKKIVQCGLEAAAEFDINIRPPFTVLSLPSGPKAESPARERVLGRICDL